MCILNVIRAAFRQLKSGFAVFIVVVVVQRLAASATWSHKATLLLLSNVSPFYRSALIKATRHETRRSLQMAFNQAETAQALHILLEARLLSRSLNQSVFAQFLRILHLILTIFHL